jgi:hypothetical protein
MDKEACIALLTTAGGGMDRIREWFRVRTFHPERQATAAVNDYGQQLFVCLADLKLLGATPDQLDKWRDGYVKRWLAYQHAGSRTANWMITGPARFPVERNNKRMEIEHRRSVELSEYASGREHWLHRQTRSIERAEASAAAAGQQFEEIAGPGVRLVKNTALDRVQLIFSEKPDEELRRRLKKSAFRWSPREGAAASIDP